MRTASHATTLPSLQLNANGEQWVQLLPLGDFQGRDGRGPYRVEDVNALIENTRQYAGKSHLAIDYDHQIEYAEKNGQPAPAAGWIKGLKAETDGLYGLVEWTQRATELIGAKEYKYLSPVFIHGKVDGVIQRILRASLTNKPNLDMKALASMESDDQEEIDSQFLAELKELLSIDDSANTSEILKKISEIISSKESPETAAQHLDYVPLGTFSQVVSELQNTKKEIARSTIQTLVGTAISSGRIPPSLKEWAIASCSQNFTQFQDFINKMPPVFESLSKEIVIYKPQARQTGTSILSDEQMEICSAMGHSPDEYLAMMKS